MMVMLIIDENSRPGNEWMGMKFLLPKALFVSVGAAAFLLTLGALGYAADIARVPWEQDPAWESVLEKAKAGDQ